ncbi:hypothetical protein V6N13_036797 [Hibiscus sabdariffa]|uniref:Uncharacterized protein n=1 Tax=Hibiscus sabdariffa TaxID=183260 RepID=A0ABR2S5U2_9ROSI
MKLQKPRMEKDMKVKAKMGRIKQNGECLREEQRRIRAKFGDRLKEETEMVSRDSDQVGSHVRYLESPRRRRFH